MRSLREGEICPLHKSAWCCGRKEVNVPSRRESSKVRMVAPGVKQFPDGREVCSPSALKRRKDVLLRTQRYCSGCGKEFTDYRDIDLAHVRSKGSGGWKHDDRIENLRLCHRILNIACGSRNLLDFINDLRRAKKPLPCEVQ